MAPGDCRKFPSVTTLSELFGTNLEEAFAQPKASKTEDITLDLNDEESVKFLARFIIDVLHDNHGKRGSNMLENLYGKSGGFDKMIHDIIDGMNEYNKGMQRGGGKSKKVTVSKVGATAPAPKISRNGKQSNASIRVQEDAQGSIEVDSSHYRRYSRKRHLLHGSRKVATKQDAMLQPIQEEPTTVYESLTHDEINQLTYAVKFEVYNMLSRKEDPSIVKDFPVIDERRYFDKTFFELIDNNKVKLNTHTGNRIATNDIVASAKSCPVEIMYDQGEQVLASELSKFESTHISMPNFIDQGDSYREKNMIISAMKCMIAFHKPSDRGRSNKILNYFGLSSDHEHEKFVRLKDSKYNLFVWFLRSVNEYYESLSAEHKNKIQLGLFINYIESVVLAEYDKCITKDEIVDLFINNGLMVEVTGEGGRRAPHLSQDGLMTAYNTWLKRKVENMLSTSSYIIHLQPVKIRVNLQVRRANGDIKHVCFLDLSYKLNGECIDLHLFGEHFQDTYSAASVSKHIEQFVVGNANHQAAHAQLFKGCLLKFIGDFGQMMYAFHMGVVFASGDLSALAIALFVLKALTRDESRYYRFKGYDGSDPVGFERWRRGLCIAESASWRTDPTLPNVTYLVDKHAYETLVDVNQGLGHVGETHPATGSKPKSVNAALKAYAATIGAVRIQPKRHRTSASPTSAMSGAGKPKPSRKR